METHKKFVNERKKILKKILKGKSLSWIDTNVSYDFLNKKNILTPYKLGLIAKSLNNEITDKELTWLLYFIGYSYVPTKIITKYYPNVLIPSDSLDGRDLVKYFILKEGNNIFVTFRGTKTLWETISTLKYYRVKFGLLDDKKDFITWRNNLIDTNEFNNTRTPLIDDNDIEIHKGFLDEANLIYKEVVQQIAEIIDPTCKNTHVILCGHSLGGVLANIIGIYLSYYLRLAVKKEKLSVSIVTANMPPIGNKNFNLLIPYLSVKNYVRVYNYQDFVPYYGYYGSWIDSKKFRHLDFILKSDIDDNKEGRFVEGKIGNTKMYVKDLGKNLDDFLRKMHLGESSSFDKKYIYHDFFRVIKKNKTLFI